MGSSCRQKINSNMQNSGQTMDNLNKLKGNRGFTLTELLVGIVILMMMTMVVSGGVSLALREYQRSFFISESNVLNTSLQAALADMLHYASNVGTKNNEIFFTNANYAINKGGYFTVDNDEGILFAYQDEKKKNNLKINVLNTGAYTDIKIIYFEINYYEDSHVFYGKYGLQSKNVTSLTRDYYFVVQSLPEKLMTAN